MTSAFYEICSMARAPMLFAASEGRVLTLPPPPHHPRQASLPRTPSTAARHWPRAPWRRPAEGAGRGSCNGIITGQQVQLLYGRTYLLKKFKVAFTVPGDNSVDLYINDIGCVVIMEPDGKTPPVSTSWLVAE